MPKLLIDAACVTSDSKGVGKYTSNLIEQIALRLDLEWEFNIAVIKGGYGGCAARPNVKLHEVPRLPELLHGMLTIPALTRKIEADYLLLPIDSVTLIGSAPTIAVVHDIPELICRAGRESPVLLRRAIDATKKQLRKRMLGKCSIVVCNSYFTAAAATKAFDLCKSKVRIGYCGVDKRFFELPSIRARDWLTLSSDMEGYILTFATGDPRERFDLCAEVFSLVRQKCPRVGLVIAGVRMGHRYSDKLLRELNARGLVNEQDFVFVPFLSEGDFEKLHALYYDAAFYLELSPHEGFGMSLAEAMACGTTCISAGGGALNEVGGKFPIWAVDHTALALAGATINGFQEGRHLKKNWEQVEFCRQYNWEAVGALLADELAKLNSTSWPNESADEPHIVNEH